MVTYLYLQWRIKTNNQPKRANSILGIEPFTFHDLKAKGVSDFKGNKQDASGHKTAAQVAVYDRKKKSFKPTK